MAKRFLVLIALLMLGFFIAGCAEGDKKSSVTNPNPSVFTPTGSISGVVFDMCKQAPVQGAVVSVAYAGGVHQVTTGATGGFSFTGVPAVEENAARHTTAWEQENGTDYTVTCDLTKLAGYGYAMVNSVEVVYSDLGDGTNSTLAKGATESGSGASTPVSGLAATTEFDVSPLTSTISGTVINITNGRVPAAGATISLYLGGRLMAAPVVSTDGTFSFADVPAASEDSYYLEVTLAGYDYATSDGYAVGKYIYSSDPNSSGVVEIDLPVPCNATLAGIEVDIFANPAKDITVPYIVSVATGGQTDVINGDAFTSNSLPALTPSSITNIVFTFDEAMKADRTIIGNAVTLGSSFTVVVTSAGPAATSPAPPAPVTLTDEDIIESYTVTMTSSGIMTITPTLKTAANFASEVPVDSGGPWGSTATFVIGTTASPTGTFTVDFVHSAYPGSAHLTDADLVPWFMDAADIGEVDSHGFFHAAGELYQDDYILSPAGLLTFTVNGH